jgi:hypothetical protein
VSHIVILAKGGSFFREMNLNGRIILQKRIQYLLWIALLMMATEREARAYADPGAGALLWQIVLSGFVGAAFYLRKFTRRLRGERKDSTLGR